MFSNIGRKVKGLAIVCFVAEAIGCIIGAIAIFTTDAVDDFAFVGVLLLLAGPVVAWASSLVLYAFGELVENSKIAADNSEVIKTGVILIAQDTAVTSKANARTTELNNQKPNAIYHS